MKSPATQSPDYLDRIRGRYLRLQGDSTELFEEVLRISVEIGLEPTLALLKTCCTEKRLAWVSGGFVSQSHPSAPEI